MDKLYYINDKEREALFNGTIPQSLLDKLTGKGKEKWLEKVKSKVEKKEA